MEYERSHRLEAEIRGKDQHGLAEEADAGCVVDREGDELACFENGFDLAMKVVQMGALAKYMGRPPKVFYAAVESDQETYVFFVGADEDEVCERARGIPAGTPAIPS